MLADIELYSIIPDLSPNQLRVAMVNDTLCRWYVLVVLVAYIACRELNGSSATARLLPLSLARHSNLLSQHGMGLDLPSAGGYIDTWVCAVKELIFNMMPDFEECKEITIVHFIYAWDTTPSVFGIQLAFFQNTTAFLGAIVLLCLKGIGTSLYCMYYNILTPVLIVHNEAGIVRVPKIVFHIISPNPNSPPKKAKFHQLNLSIKPLFVNGLMRAGEYF